MVIRPWTKAKIEVVAPIGNDDGRSPDASRRRVHFSPDCHEKPSRPYISVAYQTRLNDRSKSPTQGLKTTYNPEHYCEFHKGQGHKTSECLQMYPDGPASKRSLNENSGLLLTATVKPKTSPPTPNNQQNNGPRNQQNNGPRNQQNNGPRNTNIQNYQNFPRQNQNNNFQNNNNSNYRNFRPNSPWQPNQFRSSLETILSRKSQKS